MEYRVPPVDPIESTLFGISADLGLGGTLLVDGGPAWTAQEDFDLERARFGVGGGLRRLLPAMDMTRLEVGTASGGGRSISPHFPRCAHNG